LPGRINEVIENAKWALREASMRQNAICTLAVHQKPGVLQATCGKIHRGNQKIFLKEEADENH